jgi:hypothetical protein
LSAVLRLALLGLLAVCAFLAILMWWTGWPWLARAGRSASDPEVAAARRRLDIALGQSRDDAKELIDQCKALVSRAQSGARQVRLLGRAALVAVPIVVGLRLAAHHYGLR